LLGAALQGVLKTLPDYHRFGILVERETIAHALPKVGLNCGERSFDDPGKSEAD
jgi:hypothetical protein